MDEELTESFISAGDESAFRELYRRHTPALYALARRLVVGSEADAQDVVQNAWIGTCRGLSAFGWRSSLRTWLTGILINCARESARRRRALGEGELTEESARAAPAVGQGIDMERAIAGLPTGYCHVLVLHDIEGYTHEEICAFWRSAWARQKVNTTTRAGR